MNAYVEQKAEDLIFFLIKGAPQTKFEIFDKGEVKNENNKVEAAVIGASHYSKFDIFGQQFTEILACVELNPNEQIITQIKFKYMHAGNLNFDFGNFTYHFQWRIYPWNREGILKLLEIQTLAAQIKQNNEAIALNAIYQKEYENATQPQTFVTVQIEQGGKIVCNTIHTYPKNTREGKIVSTATVITNHPT